MNTKNRLLYLLMLPAVAAVANVSAAPYQIQVQGVFAQTDTSFPGGGSLEGDVLGLSVIYYLQIVDSTNGPLGERAFLDKSAFIAGSFTQTRPDFGNDFDVTNIDARFVTQDDMIFEVGYSKTDAGVGGDSDTLNLGVGKYLDGSTTAVFYYETEDDIDVDMLGARYRKLLDNSVAGTYVAYELGLAYVDAPNDSGFELSLGGTYYPSQHLSIGATFEYLDVGDSDQTTIRLIGDNFFTDTLFAGLAYNNTSGSSDIDTDFIGVRVGARF